MNEELKRREDYLKYGMSAEDMAEEFIRAAIDRAPEPLHRLGKYLGSVLNEDEWATAEKLLLGACERSTGPVAWCRYPEFVPGPDTECLVEAEYNGKLFRAVDKWEMQHESPLEWSSATVEVGYGWSNHDDSVRRWIPISQLLVSSEAP